MRYIQKRHTRKKKIKEPQKNSKIASIICITITFSFGKGGGVTLGDNFSIWCSASVPVTMLCGHGFAPGAQNISLSLSPPWLQAIAHWNPSKRYSADNLQSESRRYRVFFLFSASPSISVVASGQTVCIGLCQWCVDIYICVCVWQFVVF